MTNQSKEQEQEQNDGWYDWYEYGCVGDTFMVSTVPDLTKKESESGIIFSTETDVVQDRPFKGVVVAVGPESKFKKGTYVFFQPTSGFDLAFIRPTKENEKFVLLHTDAIIGYRVKDTRLD